MFKKSKFILYSLIIAILWSIYSIPVFANTASENLALNAEVSGINAEEGSEYSNVVDGDKSDNINARLSSEVNTKPYVTLDLGKEKEVKFFRLFLEDRKNTQYKNNVKEYKLVFSKDKNFTENDFSITRSLDTKTIRDDVLLSKPIDTRYIKIDILETHKDKTWDNAGIVEFEIYKTPDNFALGAKATGTNTEGSGNTYDKAIDGDYETRLSSKRGTTPNLILDLGDKEEIQFFRLFLEDRKNAQYKNNVKKYQVTFSNDEDFNDELASVKRELDTETIKENVSLSKPVNARYVKIDGIKTHQDNTWDNAGIVEFELFDHSFSEVKMESDDKIDGIRPAYDEKLNKIVVPEVEGYKTEINGVDFEQIVNKYFEIHNPLMEKKVNISLKITNLSTDDVTVTDDFEIVIPGQHKDSDGQEKPSVSPELAEWHSDSNKVFTANNDSRIVIDDNNKKSLQTMAEEFKKDYQDITGKSIDITFGDDPKEGDFYFTLDTDDSFLGKEGYHMMINDQITVKANDKVGAYWSTRTILQIMNQNENKDEIPYGETRDYPKYKVRSFMLDVARKPYSMEGLEDMTKNMAWHKMNDFQIHLNDNYIWLEDYGVGDTETEAFKAYEAFRLESDVTNKEGESPTAKDYAYSKKEFKSFIKQSSQIGVNIVPEIDVPAHSNSITKVFPELMVKNERSPLQNKRPLIDHIDISNPKAVSKIKDIFDDYTKGPDPIFDNETVVHIGADEFLSDYTAYRNFVNDFVPYIKETNTVRMWGGLSWIKDDPITKIDKDAIKNVQLNLWSKDWADGMEMYDIGYQLINTIDSYMYMVPNGSGSRGAYGDYLNTEALFNNFEPNLVSTETGWESIPSGSDQLLGAAFAIWNDNIDKRSSGITEADIYKRFQDTLPVVAEKTWANGKEKKTLDRVQSISDKIGLAPNSNPLMKEKAVDGEYASYTFEKNSEIKDSSKNNRDLSNPTNVSFENGESSKAIKVNGEESYIKTPLDKLGDDNTLSFDLKLEDASPGDILFESDSSYGTHDIRIMEDGKIGFTRELHDYTFNYKVPVEEWVHISIETSDLKTALYVNNIFIGYAEGKFIHNDTTKKSNIKNSTFSLPLKRIGSTSNSIKGILDNIVVTKGKYVDPTQIDPDTMEISASSEELEQSNTAVAGPIELAFDGDLSTIWHSQWDKNPPLPYEVNLELEEATDLSKFVYTPRQGDADGDTNGLIKAYRLEVSMDGDDYEEVSSGSWEANSDVETINLQDTKAKYVKFIVEDGVNGFASAAEFSLHKMLAPESGFPDDPDVSDLQALVEQYEESGDLSSDQSVHALNLHLKSLAHFEKSGADEKVVKHLNGFKDLLDHQKEDDQISAEAHEALTNGADALINELK